MSFSPIKICLLKLVTTDIDILPCERKSIPVFSLQREAVQVQDISGRLAIPGTVPLHYRLFFRLTKMHQVLFHRTHCFIHRKTAFPTLSQLVPATKQETSPPRRFAAVIAFSVMGVRVSLLCSAMTNVLWNLRSSDAFKKRKRERKEFDT